MPSSAELLAHALQENNLDLPVGVQQQLITYLDLMITWNRVTNLTAITSIRDMIYLHLIDSLTLLPFLTENRGPYLDIGTGAGLPGMVLAITNPDQQWVLMDKNSKKTRFLTQVVAELGLKNVQIIHDRAENFKANNLKTNNLKANNLSPKNNNIINPKNNHIQDSDELPNNSSDKTAPAIGRHIPVPDGLANNWESRRLAMPAESSPCFNTIVARAVASLKELIETTQHLLCPQGVLLAMKGKYPHEELAEINNDDPKRKWCIQTVTPISIKGMGIERHIVCMTLSRVFASSRSV